MNVALTRARRGLVVFASRFTLEKRLDRSTDEECSYKDREAWTRWICWAKAATSIVSSVGETRRRSDEQPDGPGTLTPRACLMLGSAVRATCATGNMDASEAFTWTQQELAKTGVHNRRTLAHFATSVTEDAWTSMALPPELLQELRQDIAAALSCEFQR